MKKVLITGATSGIGRELAIQYAQLGSVVGLVGRRTERLQELKEEIGELAFYRTLDVTDHARAEIAYNELIEEMGGMDIMILNAGIGRLKMLPEWESDERIVKVNALAFAHGCHFAFEYFRTKKQGQIVGMSSLASLLASHTATAYCATKHFISNYMTGYRQKAKRVKSDIVITELCTGYVWSEMTERSKGMFWVSSTEKAVNQMINAINKRKNHSYVTKRWRVIGWVAKMVPQWLWDRL